MRTLRIVCDASAKDTIVTSEVIQKFKEGEQVRVTDGPFSGALSVVARFKGHQRVGIVIDGIATVVTAYVPSGFIEKIDQ